MPAPKHPLREVTKAAWRAGIALVSSETRSRRVTRRMMCVTRAVFRCTACGARWTVRFSDKHITWRKCPRGCNARSLSKG